MAANSQNLKLSEQGLSDIFNIGYNYGTTTLFREIQCLLPGHYLKISLKTSEYTDHVFHDILNNLNGKTWKEKEKHTQQSVQDSLERDILKSVEQHTVSDAEMGVICSGGVDSSLLAVFANRYRPDIELYHACIGGGISEIHFARKVAEKLESPLHVVHVDKEQYMSNWAKCIYHNDAPSYHPNDIPLFLVCQLAQSHGKKVLISGEGADELFGGYNVNLELKKRLFWGGLLEKIPRRISSRLRGMVESFMQTDFTEEYRSLVNQMGVASTGRIQGFLFSQTLIFSKMERFDKSAEINSKLDFLDYQDKLVSGYLTERLFSHLITLLMRNDKMGMAASIETRIPFLSNTLIENWVGMPLKFKISGSKHTDLKFMLKNIAAKYLPREILYRPKVGFSIPLHHYLTMNGDFFKGGYLQDYFHLKNNRLESLYYNHNTFYKMASLEIWCQLFLMGKSIDKIQQKIDHLLIQ